jgi:hypothetical protein
MTTTDTNKQLLQGVFREMAEGNGRPFVDLMAEDITWTVLGTTSWSRTYRGKHAVLNDLMAPLFAHFQSRYTMTADHFVAEDDCVVVQCRGRVTTKAGKAYENHYCYVCRLQHGQLRQVTEYMDTDLVTQTLSPYETARALLKER